MPFYCGSMDWSDSIKWQLDVGTADRGSLPQKVNSPSSRPWRTSPCFGYPLHVIRRATTSSLPQVHQSDLLSPLRSVSDSLSALFFLLFLSFFHSLSLCVCVCLCISLLIESTSNRLMFHSTNQMRWSSASPLRRI